MDKTGFVSVIGRPNVGKSTLLNRIIGEKLSIISDKQQTTRDKIQLVYSDENSQIIFLDTPGMQKPRNELGKFMLKESKSSIEESDLVLYVVDVSDYLGSREKEIIELLKEYNKPVILAINKIDTISKDAILKIIAMYDEVGIFDEVVPISASMGTNVDVLIESIKKHLDDGPRYYPDDYITDKSERFIVSEIIREKALIFLKEEVPHGIGVVVDTMEEKEDETNISATIYAEKSSHKGIIIGKGGSMIKKIRIAAKNDIERFLDTNVNLELMVKVEKNWRDKENIINYFGYK